MKKYVRKSLNARINVLGVVEDRGERIHCATETVKNSVTTAVTTLATLAFANK